MLNIATLIDLSKGTIILQIVVAVLIFIALDVFVLIILKRALPRTIVISLSILLLVFSLLNMPYLAVIFALFYFTSLIIFIYGNIADFRWLISNTVSNKDRRIKRVDRKIYDQEAVINQLNIAVQNLSKTKMGALISIERSISMNDLVRNGTMINAPVNAILLSSIFYKGTALHDGAVVIRDNMILAASVYFTPSTKALTGKVGSRHRAALGISEITDAVTIVVSEETGRISIAYKGNLQSVNPDDFKKVLTEYLSDIR